MKLALTAVLAALVGLVVGMLVGRNLAAAPDATDAPAPRPLEARSDGRTPLAGDGAGARRDEREPRVEDAPAPSPRVEEGLISAELRRYALAEIEAGWHERREDALPGPLRERGFSEFEVRVRAMPREIGRRLAEERSRLDQLAGDDPFAVIEALRGGGLGPQLGLVDDDARFQRFFDCGGGPRVDGVGWLAAEAELHPEIAPGSTIVFPPGVYDVGRIAERLRKAVRCVAIAGAGIDRTLLHVRSFDANDRLDRFELRDCTLFSQCDAIDLNVAGVWRAERVRFVGFDCGAGGCGVFSVMRGAIVDFEDCRIEGGFGHHPGDGCLFDVRTPALVARFRRCALRSLALDAAHWPQGVTVLFDRCGLDDLLDSAPPAEHEDGRLVLRATGVELRAPDAGRVAARALSELNPAW